VKLNDQNGGLRSGRYWDFEDIGGITDGVMDVPLVGDFNDDGYADIGVYIPKGNEARWVVKLNDQNGGLRSGRYWDFEDIGGPGETPVIGDFNGDGYADAGVYVPNGNVDARWVIRLNRGDGALRGGSYFLDLFDIGGEAERPLVADFNDDGHADIGVYIPGEDDARWVVKHFVAAFANVKQLSDTVIDDIEKVKDEFDAILSTSGFGLGVSTGSVVRVLEEAHGFVSDAVGKIHGELKKALDKVLEQGGEIIEVVTESVESARDQLDALSTRITNEFNEIASKAKAIQNAAIQAATAVRQEAVTAINEAQAGRIPSSTWVGEQLLTFEHVQIIVNQATTNVATNWAQVEDLLTQDLKPRFDHLAADLRSLSNDFRARAISLGEQFLEFVESVAEKAVNAAKHIGGFDYRLWRFLIAEGSVNGPTLLDKRTKSTYDGFRDEVFDDSHILKLPVNGKDKDTGFIDVGDSDEDHAFKNGLALIAMAIEGDDARAIQLLNNFLEHGFDATGEPVRLIPSDAKKQRTDIFEDGGGVDSYSVDQFLPQLVGIHFAWKYGSDEVRTQAKKLMKTWLEVLDDNNGRLGPDTGIGTREFDQTLDVGRSPVTGVVFGSPSMPLLVEHVAAEMGLSYSALGQDIDTAVATLGNVQSLIRDYIKTQLGRIKWRSFYGVEHSLPDNVRGLLADSISSRLTVYDHLLKVPQFIDTALSQLSFALEVSGWRDDVEEFLLQLLPFVVQKEVAEFSLIAAQYALIDKLYLLQGSGASATPGHLFFWQAVLYDEFHPVAATLLQPLKKRAQAATAQHRWLHYDLLAGIFDEPVKRLANWPKTWEKEHYMFKHNRKHQNDTFGGSGGPEPQLGYLVLHALGRHFGAIERD
jgi:hypothetical protein